MKRWLARIALLVVSPLLLVLFLELGYRGWLWLQIAPQTEGEAFEVYAIGASTVRGEPYPEHLGFPQMLRGMLGGEVQGKPVRVHLLAESGYTIYPQAIALRRALRYRNADNPAAVLIYVGHNEGLQPVEPDHPLRGWKRFKTRLMGRSMLLADLILRYERRNDVEDIRDLAHYEAWLTEAIAVARAAGAVPFLSTVVSNVAGIEPGLHLEVSGLEVHAQMKALQVRRKAEGCETLLSELDAAATQTPSAAPLFRYEKARCLRTLGRSEEAWAEFEGVLADAPDMYFGRARPAQNARIRELCKRLDVPLVDTWARFSAASKDRIIDSTLFSDGHHPNLEGYRLIAEGFAEAIARHFGVTVERDFDLGAWARSSGMDDQTRVSAHSMAASWLFSVSPEHPWPVQRFAFANTHIDAALALRPQAFDALMMRGLIAAAQTDPGMLLRPEDVAWLNESGLFYFSWDLCSQGDQAEAVLARLEGYGVDAALIAQIRAAAREDVAARCGG